MNKRVERAWSLFHLISADPSPCTRVSPIAFWVSRPDSRSAPVHSVSNECSRQREQRQRQVHAHTCTTATKEQGHTYTRCVRFVGRQNEEPKHKPADRCTGHRAASSKIHVLNLNTWLLHCRGRKGGEKKQAISDAAGTGGKKGGSATWEPESGKKQPKGSSHVRHTGSNGNSLCFIISGSGVTAGSGSRGSEDL